MENNKDIYSFLRTTIVDGKVLALMSNLPEARVKDLRNAFKANAAPTTRTGNAMTLKQLEERLLVLREHEVPNSIAAFECAIKRVKEKTLELETPQKTVSILPQPAQRQM